MLQMFELVDIYLINISIFKYLIEEACVNNRNTVVTLIRIKDQEEREHMFNSHLFEYKK